MMATINVSDLWEGVFFVLYQNVLDPPSGAIPPGLAVLFFVHILITVMALTPYICNE